MGCILNPSEVESRRGAAAGGMRRLPALGRGVSKRCARAAAAGHLNIIATHIWDAFACRSLDRSLD